MVDITFVGSATGSGAAGANASINVGGITGIADGDFLVVMSAVYVRAAGDGLATTNGSGSFTEVINELTNNSTRRLRLAHKFRNGDTTVTIAGTGNASDAVSGIVFAFRNVDTTTPLDGVTPTHAINTVASAPDPPSITTSSDRCLVVVCAASPVRDTTIGTPAGFATSVYATPTSQTNNAETGATYLSSPKTPAGAVDAAAFGSWTTTNNLWVTGAIVLRPLQSVSITVPQGNISVIPPSNITNPSFISNTATVFNTSTSPKTTASIAVQNGDVLVADTFCETAHDGANPVTISIATASGSTSSWTLQEDAPYADANHVYVRTWTASATATGNITVSFTYTAANKQFGGTVKVWRGSNGIGNVNHGDNNTGAGQPTVSVTTTQDHSGLDFADADWNAVSGTVTFTGSDGTPVQDVADQSGAGSTYCLYSSHDVDVSGAGSKTMGMSSPTGQRYVATVIEVLGTAGAGGGTAPTVTIAPAGGDVSIYPPQGNLADSPTAPTVARTDNIWIYTPQGNIALSEVAPSFDRGIYPPQGNITLSEIAPTVQAGGSVNVSPDRKDIALSPTAPTMVLTITTDISPARRDIALSSIAPIVARTDHHPINTPQGNVATSPSTPDVQAGAGVSKVVPTGDRALSPTAPTVGQTLNIALSIPQGNIGLSEVAPAPSVGINRQTLARDVILSPTAPTVARTGHVWINPPQGNETLSQTAPNALVSVNIARDPPARDVGLSSLAPTASLSVNWSPLPVTRDAVLSTTAPTVAQTMHRNIMVPQANAVLTEEAPSTGGTVNRILPQGNIAISGTAPAVARTDHHWINPASKDFSSSSVAPIVFASLHHPIIVPKQDLALTTLPAQLIPGVYFYPLSAQLNLNNLLPEMAFGRSHHWRRKTSLNGNMSVEKELSGVVSLESNLIGSIDQDQTLDSG